MKSILSLYRTAEKKQIHIICYTLQETGSMSIEMDGKCYIGIDEAALGNSASARVHLAHELGHCVTGSFYNRYTSFDLRQKHENRANRWAIRRLIPEGALNSAVAAGHTELWDLAELFDVTEDFMQKALAYYTQLHQN